jgi:hypothetical protein
MTVGTRMTYDTSGEARNPKYPTVDDLPKKPRKPLRRNVMAIIITVVVVLIAAVSGAIYFSETPHSLHVGVISDSSLEKLSNYTFQASIGNNSTNGSLSKNITEVNTAFFFNKAGYSFVGIESVEFISTAYNLNFYDSQYSNQTGGNHSSFHNGSYRGFDYFYGVSYLSGNYTFLAVGESGSYGFYIEDFKAPLSSATALIHDEIQAMTN